jgi:predicted phosphodiesterase
MKTLTLLVLASVLASCAELQTQTPKSDDSTGPWVTIGSGASVTARVATRTAECPEIVLDGKGMKMSLRSPSDDLPAFNVKVCESLIPSGTKDARIGNQKIPVFNPSPKRIVIIGDTGCRVKGKTKESAWVQNCNDPKTWPFLKIADLAASLNPDLVIHVGDYLYREAPCPKGLKECEGSPSGDSMASWNADLFKPANQLLQASPWIFVRGNHESCARAGEGFRRLLDPNPYSPICVEHPDPFSIPLENLQIAMIDTSQEPANKARLQSLNSLKLKNAVLLSHRPLWGDESPEIIGPIPGVKLVLSGHWHTFHMSEYEDRRGTQVVTGNSGTELIKNPKQIAIGTVLDGSILKTSNTISEFGFTVLDRVGGHWELKVYNLNGQILLKKKLRF